MQRRTFIRLAGSSATAWPLETQAQSYPIQPVRLVVGFPPGGSADLIGRIFAKALSERLGQSFIVENKPGSGGNIAAETAIRARPDGYTLLLAVSPNAINATLYRDLNFDFVRDTAPVAGLIQTPHVLVVNPAVPAKTVPEFVAYAKANPGKLNMASGGNGTPAHICGELFKMMTGVNMVHVPYRGAGPALADLIAGQVQVEFDNLSSSIEYIRAGKLRALGVTTAKRSDALADIPAIAEFVPGYDASSFFGIVAPRGAPPDIVSRLNQEINAALTDPRIREQVANLGGMTLPGSPEDFGRRIAEDTEKWAKVVKFSGARVD